ncbi:hypothetical protein KP77_29910 [Jeotgalibacillus alimentarius]|uniref:Uncharacterized protein n=1 Tax=Jeotgalibacillus alimentarius TaxID=135826 RepID=A0A0C2V4X0_9BACL|nr:hypothetical protein [Jeotgalibacillus alimentarius]KIL44042.1 hypothetical protein KP77_29910 [Jeotgalibacillus alimentarius]
MNILNKHLTKDQKIAINLYISRDAREVDRAFHQFRQGEGKAESVVRVLESYQNADGGFGHALEPDRRLIDSSVLETTVALQYLMQLPISREHPMVSKALNYLEKQYDGEQKLFPIVPVTVNHVPSAPWWHVNEAGETGFEKTPGNPSAEVLGYFQRCRPHSIFTAKLETDVLNRLDEITEWDMHEIQCYYRLAEMTPKPDLQRRIIQKIIQHVQFTQNPEEWQGYGLQPIQLIKNTQSPLYGKFEDIAEENAAWYAQQLHAEGYWNPSWEWGQYPVEWALSKKDWQSYLTVNACHPPQYLMKI